MICEEIGKFLGAECEVFVIELTLGEAGKVTVCAVFGDFAADSEDGGVGEEVLQEVEELVFISAGSVEGEDDGGCGFAFYISDVKI